MEGRNNVKNLFDLKLFYKDENCATSGKEITNKEDYLSSHYKTILLPVMNYKSTKLTVGDIFFNRKTKSLYIFSLLTDKNISAIKKIGLFHIKDYDSFLNMKHINVTDFLQLGNKNDIELFQLNSIDFDKIEKIGNIILNNSKIITHVLIKIYQDYYSSVSEIKDIVINTSTNIELINNPIIAIKENNSGRFNSGGYNTYYINGLSPHVIFEEDFCFTPKIAIKYNNLKNEIFSFHKTIGVLNKSSTDDDKLSHKYMSLIDLETFQSKILFSKEEVDINYFAKSMHKYKVLKEDDNDYKTYLENMLYFV